MGHELNWINLGSIQALTGFLFILCISSATPDLLYEAFWYLEIQNLVIISESATKNKLLGGNMSSKDSR